MTAKKPTNLADSVRARLLNRAREKGEDFQVTLRNYCFERFLYRLSRSSLSQRFVLKGAMLFRLWAEQPYRATMDLDLLSRGGLPPDSVAEDIAAICTTAVDDDGVHFDAASIKTAPIRAEEEYSGIRAVFIATLGTIREPLQIDVGFGDALWPPPEEMHYPVMLEFPAPVIAAYKPETVIAEKLEAMVTLAIRNSRIKDYFDLYYLAQHDHFDGPILTEAIRRTFDRRRTPIPLETPVGLLDEYWSAPGREAQIQSFARRARLAVKPAAAPAMARQLREFLLPPLQALSRGERFEQQWLPGGPWRVD
jgi:predicted nucleotidyltransferase component of viral defense system